MVVDLFATVKLAIRNALLLAAAFDSSVVSVVADKDKYVVLPVTVVGACRFGAAIVYPKKRPEQ